MTHRRSLAAAAGSLLLVATAILMPTMSAGADGLPTARGNSASTTSPVSSRTDMAEPAAEQRATVVPGATTLTAHWPRVAVPLAAETLHVVLPSELAALDIEAFSWSLTAESDSSGSVPGSATAIDIPVPADVAAGSELSLLISTASSLADSGTGSGDSAMLWSTFELIQPVDDAPALDVFDVELRLDSALQSDVRRSFGGDPSPAVLVPGAPFGLDAEPGFWPTGPASEAVEPSDGQGPVRATLSSGGAGPAASVDLATWVSDDGAHLQLAVPETLPSADSAGELTLRVNFERAGDDLQGIPLIYEVDLTVRVSHTVTASRIDAADRYGVAVAVSQQAFPDGAPVAYVVTGRTFPDALTAAPAAAAQGGPVLFSDGSELMPEVRAELERLSPDSIVVVGGPASLSAAVEGELASLADTVRIGGADRYEVSRNLLVHAFPDGASRVFVTTGHDVTDALSAGGAAGSGASPLLLVDGTVDELDSDTAAVLTAAGTTSLTLVGGLASVSAELESGLNAIAPTVRHEGVDRFATSRAVSLAAFDTAERALLVSGDGFPDALTAAAWAGGADLPVYAVPAECVPADTLTALHRQGVREVTLVGGEAALAAPVLALTPCA